MIYKHSKEEFIDKHKFNNKNIEIYTYDTAAERNIHLNKYAQVHKAISIYGDGEIVPLTAIFEIE